MTNSYGLTRETTSWDVTATLMQQLIAPEDPRQSEGDDDLSLVRRGLDLLKDMRSRKSVLYEKSCQIKSSVNDDIEKENNALTIESNEIASQIQRVDELERKIKDLKICNAEIIARTREAELNIPLYKAEAAEVIDDIDATEMQRMRAVPRIEKEYSLYALITNVKWDYGRNDVLAGEVAIASKSVIRRFEIDKDLTEFEIADKFWNVVEGV